MTYDKNISKIKTGRGVAGAHVGVIYAPEHAQAGSMASLVQFFNMQQDIKAFPGYEDAEQHHVLRVSGFDDDDALRTALSKDYPAWCKKEGLKPTISLADDMVFDALDKAESFPFKSPINKFIKEHANGLTGASFIIGNMGILYSGWTNPTSVIKKHDWFKVYSSAAYNTSSILLTILGNNADNPRDAYSIMEQVYPNIQHADKEVKQKLYNHTENVLNFMKKHPWEVSAGISFTGAASHFMSCTLRDVKMAPFELVATIGTMVGMLVTTLVPEKGGHSEIDISDMFANGHQPSLLSTTEKMTETPQKARHVTGILDHISDLLGGNPLRASAVISGLANIGYGVDGYRQGDKGLMTMAGGYIAGNIIQTKATKGKGTSFDALVSAAADMIHADPAVAHMDKSELSKRVNDVVNALSGERDVVHSKKAMTAGISARLQRLEPTTQVTDPLLKGFLAEEAAIITASPFLSSHTMSLASNASPSIGSER